MTAREWLDAVEARANAAKGEATTLLAAVDAFDGRKHSTIEAMPSTWERVARVAADDVPALVAALRAVLDVCDTPGDRRAARFGGKRLVYAHHIVAAIDAHLGGAS